MNMAQNMSGQPNAWQSAHTPLTATRRSAGYTAIGGAVTMLLGAVLAATTGTDLWLALDTGDMATYLVAAGQYQGQLIGNLTLWIIGVLLIGVAQTQIAEVCQARRTQAQAASVMVGVGVPLAIVAFIAMLALVVQIAPDTSADSLAIANVVGWIGVRADDLATTLLIGVAPWLLAHAARDEWMPRWLVRWGYLAGIVGIFSLVLLYVPILALKPLALLIVPVGIFWLIAAGIVLLRRG